MKNKILFTIALLSLIMNVIKAQKITNYNAKDILSKCINFHDPKGNWAHLHQKIYLNTKTPNNDTIGYEEFLLDNRTTYFCYLSHADGKLIEKEMSDTVAIAKINGDTALSAEDIKKYRLLPRQIKSARNYYVYLYGLPMKLNDKGTILSDTVKIDTFNGKNCPVLSVKYEKGIGTDTWFFYINPTTYALEGYRFNHNRKPNDGEFIICEELIEVGGIRIPKIRKWYYNENKKYIATDILEKTEDWVGKK